MDQLPDAYQRFADLESSAVEINCYETGVIPGLLQSEGYMRAILSEGEGMWWDPSTTEAADRLAYRVERQRRVLESNEQRMLRFVITEDALRANMGTRPPFSAPPPNYDSEVDTAILGRAFYRAWELSLSRTASRRLIESLAKE